MAVEVLPSVEESPVPVFIHQDGRFVYCNRAAEVVLRRIGIICERCDLYGVDMYAFMAEDEVALARANMIKMSTGVDALFNLERTMVDKQGRRFKLYGAIRRTTWEGREAFLTSGVFIGPLDEQPHPEGLSLSDRAEHLDVLTDKERHVALLVAEGFGNDNIAAILGVQVSTVRTHLKHIYRKTGILSRVELGRLFSSI